MIVICRSQGSAPRETELRKLQDLDLLPFKIFSFSQKWLFFSRVIAQKTMQPQCLCSLFLQPPLSPLPLPQMLGFFVYFFTVVNILRWEMGDCRKNEMKTHSSTVTHTIVVWGLHRPDFQLTEQRSTVHAWLVLQGTMPPVLFWFL